MLERRVPQFYILDHNDKESTRKAHQYMNRPVRSPSQHTKKQRSHIASRQPPRTKVRQICEKRVQEYYVLSGRGVALMVDERTTQPSLVGMIRALDVMFRVNLGRLWRLVFGTCYGLMNLRGKCW